MKKFIVLIFAEVLDQYVFFANSADDVKKAIESLGNIDRFTIAEVAHDTASPEGNSRFHVIRLVKGE
jgi:hypothetical protein